MSFECLQCLQYGIQAGLPVQPQPQGHKNPASTQSEGYRAPSTKICQALTLTRLILDACRQLARAPANPGAHDLSCANALPKACHPDLRMAEPRWLSGPCFEAPAWGR